MLRCESENHDTAETAEYPRFVDCWGELRTCPVCRKRICYADGCADDVDTSIPDICDSCWCEVVTSNPKETGDGDGDGEC